MLHAHAEAPVVEAFARLWAGARKPPLMVAGKMEGRLLMHHLLLHADNAHPEGGYAGWGLPPAQRAHPCWEY